MEKENSTIKLNNSIFEGKLNNSIKSPIVKKLIAIKIKCRQ